MKGQGVDQELTSGSTWGTSIRRLGSSGGVRHETSASSDAQRGAHEVPSVEYRHFLCYFSMAEQKCIWRVGI